MMAESTELNSTVLVNGGANPIQHDASSLLSEQLSRYLHGWSNLQIFATAFLILLAYDQRGS